MKARMLREEEITHPNLKTPADVTAWRAKLNREEITPQEWREGMFLRVKAGTVIDHPHAYKLCQMGMAEPHDQECLDRCNRLRLDLDAAAAGQDRIRNAQLTGDPRYDRSNDAEFEQPTTELSQQTTIVIPRDVLAVKIDPATAPAPEPVETLADPDPEPAPAIEPAEPA